MNLILPKTRAYDDSNDMHDIFLLLTQAVQFEFLKNVRIFCTTLNPNIFYYIDPKRQMKIMYRFCDFLN